LKKNFNLALLKEKLKNYPVLQLQDEKIILTTKISPETLKDGQLFKKKFLEENKKLELMLKRLQEKP
jgi:hypothetical protein